MKRFSLFFFGIIIGILITLLYFEKRKNTEIRQQSNVILENIRKLNKLIVTEAYFNEVYSYSDSKKYFFDQFEFNKNAILLVNAKAQVSYDLSQLKIKVDSIEKIIKIIDIPKEEINIIPNIKYYDLKQSKFNLFTKEELNRINHKAIERIKSNIEIQPLKKRAKKRLLEELENIYILSKTYGWKVEENNALTKLKNKLKP